MDPQHALLEMLLCYYDSQKRTCISVKIEQYYVTYTHRFRTMKLKRKHQVCYLADQHSFSINLLSLCEIDPRSDAVSQSRIETNIVE